MRGIPVWVWIIGAVGIILIIGQWGPNPLLQIGGGGISLNLPQWKVASGNVGPAQSTTGVLV